MKQTQTPSPNQSTTQKNGWWILASIGAFAFMSNLDSSIVNIAMPVMSKQLHVPMNQIEWVVSAYLIILSALLLFFGKLGDLYGKVKIFRIGTVVFLAGSFISGLQINFPILLVGRAIQGTGAAMTLSNTYGITTSTFGVKERGRAMGFVGTFVALGAIAGPGLGGLILSQLPWGYIFWVNLPIGIVAIILGAIVMPKAYATTGSGIDWWGFINFSLLIFGLFLGVFLGQEIGYTKPIPLVLFAVAIVAFWGFIRSEKRAKNPLMPLTLFRIKPFTYGLGAAVLIFLSNFFTVVIVPFYLEDARGLSAGQAGALLIIFPVVMVFAGPIGGWFADHFSPANVASIGLGIVAFAQALYYFLTLTSPMWVYVIITIVMALGTGLFQSPNSDIVMSVVPKDQLGSAGSLNALARNIGMISGTALSTSSLFIGMSVKAGFHVTTYLPSQPETFIFGMHVAFAISLIIILGALALSILQGRNVKQADLK
ncbi:MFS transporter [Lentilactobacillus parafarraginis]|jgi:EmrB/QacA subfamily drug resistance transporter|uniref:Transporter, major facilitator family protein n=2 Tax=Lentilactobacillus parafarraginis TaxID=390842 RepID=A0A0R1YS68_9LACO|nr:MFS transporter [Lentilactobacillus parafarraginis]KRM43668.1 transporter, major facilitator family protein [Lentilactobacillus parafarraginis DSM 18390 = JCM 14109]TLQ18588.1 MFS transporter [Lentilactobacillus parafarraginis]